MEKTYNRIYVRILKRETYNNSTSSLAHYFNKPGPKDW